MEEILHGNLFIFSVRHEVSILVIFPIDDHRNYWGGNLGCREPLLGSYCSPFLPEAQITFLVDTGGSISNEWFSDNEDRKEYER